MSIETQVSNYKIVTAGNEQALAESVTASLKSGWQLSGGVAVAFIPSLDSATGKGSMWFSQAMIMIVVTHLMDA